MSSSSRVSSRLLSSFVGRRVPRSSFDGPLSGVAPSSPSRCVCLLFVGGLGCVCVICWVAYQRG